MAPACACHGEPSYWQKDTRRRIGGHWYCAVKAREGARARHDQAMDDPLWRHQRRMRQAAYKRRMTLKRRAPANPRMAEFLAVTRKG